MDRTLSSLDRFIDVLDQGLRLSFGPSPAPERETPAAGIPDTELGSTERALAGCLMRVNHSGEVCAQALYQGQAITAKSTDVREKLQRSAQEENDHLAWTSQRVAELGTHTSYLNLLWYTGSFAVGAIAGLVGDRVIVERMREDEGRHATVAIEAGAHDLPGPIKCLMRATARLMTTTAHWI